ncbi:AtpZ/AtpI family protein [Vicingaceae bacterium]|nr:AtpZ/AtpI family protein [Vicingaceae bacterium]MDB4060792.1 AtpZ/AtpI family protein [Vicingaceae bacterium]
MTSEKDPKKKRPRYLALTGIAFQMGITIYLFSFLGKYLDNRYSIEDNYWTIGLTLIGVVLSFYSLLKQVNRINKEEENDK